MAMHDTLYLPLSEIASRAGLVDRPVAWHDGEAVDRAAFLALVARWQAAFEAQRGERWALYVENPLQFAAALYGAWHAGKTVYLPGDAQPATAQRLRAVTDGLAGDWPDGVQALQHPSDSPRAPLDLQRTRLVLFTSGSSGEPVAIDKAVAQLDAEIRMQHELFGVRWARHESLCVHATVSHQHIYGLLFAVLWPLAAGRRFATRRIGYAEEMIARLAATPSLLVASPAHLKRLPPGLDGSAARKTLQAVLSSGGPLPPDSALQAAQCFGDAPIEIFGSSETGGIAWRQRTRDGDAWRPLPGVDWKIDEGLLAVRSPHLPNADWWLTADRAESREDGRFVLLGRADRIAKIEEKRVSLSAIERRLQESPWVGEVRAVAVAVGAGLRVGVVYVPTAAGQQALAEQGPRAVRAALRELVRGHVDAVAVPRRWREVAALPVNAQGKTTEAALLALLAPRDELPAMRWIERGDALAQGEFGVDAGHPGFDGHFPQAPILPGVLQLQWAIQWARQCFGLRADVARIEVLKFQQPVLPGAELKFSLRRASPQTLQFAYESARGMHASGRIVFASEGAA
jgi:acyl-coenzyme A synthetase/AMP-(fatty) acid ligase/3-hydroxymyristoyl/3-hydroxydecanoyl-(acyl carrier protein) dehydratase